MIFTIARSQKQMPFRRFLYLGGGWGIPKGALPLLARCAFLKILRPFRGVNFEKRLNVLCEAKGLLDVY